MNAIMAQGGSMNIYINIKALAKRRPLIEKKAFEVDGEIASSNGLISCIVRRNVEAYNAKAVDTPIFPYMTSDALANASATGKIGFGDRKSENAADATAAVENAIQSFRDGIFKLFVFDNEVMPDEPLTIHENDEITLIRLTMLAGRLW
jgi:hypothetical protein